jgi:quinol monooxygenase YgiN
VGGTFGLVVKFTLKPGHEDAFDKLVDETLPGIRDREPGTLIYTCHVVQDAPAERVFYELYADRAAFDAHEGQPHVRSFLAEREQHLDGVAVDFLTLAGGKGVPAGG